MSEGINARRSLDMAELATSVDPLDEEDLGAMEEDEDFGDGLQFEPMVNVDQLAVKKADAKKRAREAATAEEESKKELAKRKNAAGVSKVYLQICCLN